MIELHGENGASGASAKRKKQFREGEPWAMPPIVKIYEALGALGDGRVSLVDDATAVVESSDRTRQYLVKFGPAERQVAANDNASSWQGYLGYPAVAAMIARGWIKAPGVAQKALAGIPWRELNRRFKNDYDKTLAEVSRRLSQAGYKVEEIHAAVQGVLDELQKLAPLRGRWMRPGQGSKNSSRLTR